RPLFLDETPIPASGVITLDRKRDAAAPTVKRKRMQAFDFTEGSYDFEQSPQAPDLNMPHQEASGHTSIREWKSRTSVEVPDLSALDTAIVGPSTVQGPLYDLFDSLGDDVEDPSDAGFEGKPEVGADYDMDDEE
ncbi:hypothetical protein HAX54_004112, partial [Datura stramonium]|nr:hypothetical protein [Datura stramonium]